jgi:hypothetical protein
MTSTVDTIKTGETSDYEMRHRTHALTTTMGARNGKMLAEGTAEQGQPSMMPIISRPSVGALVDRLGQCNVSCFIAVCNHGL